MAPTFRIEERGLASSRRGVAGAPHASAGTESLVPVGPGDAAPLDLNGSAIELLEDLRGACDDSLPDTIASASSRHAASLSAQIASDECPRFLGARLAPTSLGPPSGSPRRADASHPIDRNARPRSSLGQLCARAHRQAVALALTLRLHRRQIEDL